MSTGMIMPPVPPLNDGVFMDENRFEYIADEDTRKLIINGFQAVTRTEMWEFMKKDPGEVGYMFSNRPEISIISNMMDKCEYPPGHSGASFGCTMRHLQYIARYGQEAYKQNFQKC